MRRKNCGSCKHFQPLFPPIPKADSYDISGECVYPVPTLPFAWSEAQPFFIVAADGATCKTYTRAALAGKEDV